MEFRNGRDNWTQGFERFDKRPHIDDTQANRMEQQTRLHGQHAKQKR